MAPDFIEISREQMIEILQAVIHDFIVNKRFAKDSVKMDLREALKKAE